MLFRDILADSASKATSKLRPSDDDLAQMDAAAPDNTWHEAPVLSKDDLKQRAQGVYKKNKPANASNVPVGEAPTGELQGSAKEVTENKTAEYRARTREYLRSKMPQERRDHVVWRLKVSSALGRASGEVAVQEQY